MRRAPSLLALADRLDSVAPLTPRALFFAYCPERSTGGVTLASQCWFPQFGLIKAHQQSVFDAMGELETVVEMQWCPSVAVALLMCFKVKVSQDARYPAFGWRLLLSCFTFSSVSRSELPCSSLVRASLDAVESLCLTVILLHVCSAPSPALSTANRSVSHEGHVQPFKPPPASAKETKRPRDLRNYACSGPCSRRGHLHSMDGGCVVQQ